MWQSKMCIPFFALIFCTAMMVSAQSQLPLANYPPANQAAVPVAGASKRGNPLSVSQSRDDEPYSVESRWGRVLIHRWADPSYPSFLQIEIEKSSTLDFWSTYFTGMLKLQPEKAKLRMERLALRKDAQRAKQKGFRKARIGNVENFDDWKEAFLEDPFRIFKQLPLHTFKDPYRDGDILLYQLEKEYEYGNMQKRCAQLRRFKSSVKQKTFLGALADGFAFGADALRKSEYMDDAAKLYIPVITHGPAGRSQADAYLRELQILSEMIDMQTEFRLNSIPF